MSLLPGVVHLRDVAVRMGVTPRCCKRRLKRHDAKLEAEGNPDRILRKFSPRGDWFADLRMILRYFPGLNTEDVQDPVAETLGIVRETKEMVQEVLDRLAS